MPEFARLLEGYRRFRKSAWPQQRARFEKLAREGQAPQLLVIACSDSRVDPAQIFDVDPGEIFVIRNIAALVPPFETTPGRHGVSAALEYAVEFLKVRQIVVMGHGSCGGCETALTGSLAGTQRGAGGFIADWIALLDDARETVLADPGIAGEAAGRAMELAAVRVSLANLRTFPGIARREATGALVLRGTYFAIADGVLELLDEADGCFKPV